MDNKGALSSAFDMPLDFISVVVPILLYGFITQDISIYIGTGIELIFSYRSLSRKGVRIPSFIPCISIGILTLLTLASLIPGDFVSIGVLPLTLKVSMLILTVTLFLHRRRFINRCPRQSTQYSHRLLAQGAESAVIPARVVSVLGIPHFTVINLTILIAHPPTPTFTLAPYHILSPAILILNILFNRVGIRYFNHVVAHIEYVSIVNTRGGVVGGSLAVEAIDYKNAYVNPVMRIAISIYGMLFPYNCPQSCVLDKFKTDVPIECYPRYGETLAEGVGHLLSDAPPKTSDLKPTFTASYYFENARTNRLIYLLIIEMENNSILCDPRSRGGKLWASQQIEHNLDTYLFSECFKSECEHLKQTIGIGGKYKVS